ncbi:hypothetical protein J6590_078528 [Homalodisca vitripennis]|nr:hypothetical protein J6590_078528 [Homalodisca vitripennis]
MIMICSECALELSCICSSNLCCCTAAVPVVARTLLSLLTVAARPGPARTSAACGWFLLSLAPNITDTGPVPQCHGTGRRNDELNF